MRFLAFPIAASAEHALDFDVRAQLPGGLRSARFEKNPLVLFGHDGDGIGTVHELTIRDGVLSGRVRLSSAHGQGVVAQMRGGLIRYAELAVDNESNIVELSLVGPFTPGAELLETPTADAGDTSPRILADGEHLFPGDRTCSCAPNDHPRKELPMSQSDSNDSPFVAAQTRIAARRRQALGPLAHSKAREPGAFAVPSRQFDAGNESEVVAALRKIVDAAARGELDKASAKEGARLLDVLAELFEATPDSPEVRREREESQARDAADDDSPVMRVAKAQAERAKRGLPPLAMNRDEVMAERGGGDAA